MHNSFDRSKDLGLPSNLCTIRLKAKSKSNGLLSLYWYLIFIQSNSSYEATSPRVYTGLSKWEVIALQPITTPGDDTDDYWDDDDQRPLEQMGNCIAAYCNPWV